MKKLAKKVKKNDFVMVRLYETETPPPTAGSGCTNTHACKGAGNDCTNKQTC
jgi:hypothetical protein